MLAGDACSWAIGAARDSAVGAVRHTLGPASTPRADYCFDPGASTKAASTRCTLVANLGLRAPTAALPCFGDSAGIAAVDLRALSGERNRGRALARRRRSGRSRSRQRDRELGAVGMSKADVSRRATCDARGPQDAASGALLADRRFIARLIGGDGRRVSCSGWTPLIALLQRTSRPTARLPSWLDAEGKRTTTRSTSAWS